jgi:hypothetical protein
MTFIDLAPLTINTEYPINLVEVFLYKSDKSTTNTIDLSVSSNIVQRIENYFKNPKITEYKSYYINDKIYTYEVPNDNQIVTSKHMINTKSIRRTRNDTDLYIVSYRVEKYPIYMFPCTNNIDYVSAYNIKEFKINNRITINIKTDEDSIHTVFVEYKHSDNVELDRINETIGRLLHRI